MVAQNHRLQPAACFDAWHGRRNRTLTPVERRLAGFDWAFRTSRDVRRRALGERDLRVLLGDLRTMGADGRVLWLRHAPEALHSLYDAR